MTDFTKVQQALERRGYTVRTFAAAAEAAAYLDGAIDGKTVGFGGSATLDALGVYDKLAAHNTVIWHWKQEANAARKAAMQTQVYLSSANGLAESGEIVNIDGTGNRVSATLFGHEKVYFVIGRNKLAPTYEAAVYRARNVAAPQRARQLGKKTPCAVKLRHLTLLLCVSLSLTGCSALLERNYATVEPHSSKFWESEAAGTLRAENYQDIVNDLLILIGQHTESATVRLYNYEDDLTVADTLEQATTEVQQETPMGAYAVEYITASSRSQRGYYEISIQVSYRRTAEQIQAVVNATSTEALSALLEAALDEGRTELAVRVGYWGEDGQARVEETVAQLREARGLAETPPWTISYYPAQGPVGLIEFVMGGDAAAAAEENSENLAEES